MNALTFQGKEKISYTTVPDPVILDPGDAIVRVSCCAICGSDLHVYHEREKGIERGTAMGHEFTGEIVEVGEQVKNFKTGDLVMSPFTTSCGQCFYCRAGLTCRCIHSQLFGWVENGHGLHGGQAEWVRVPLADSTLVKIPDGISREEALLLGDVLSTGFYCARQAQVKSNGVYAIVGCGPVGLMAVIGAREMGAQKIFAIDTQPERLEKAKEFGAIPIDASNQSAREVIQESTEGRGADGILEAVGSGPAVKLAYELVRPGGIISSVGVCTDANLAFSPVEAYNKNLTYTIGRCPARFMMNQLVPLVQQKKYNIASLFTHRMKLEQGAVGYEIFSGKKDNCLKVLLEVG
ncbi:MAG: alcohol dehydrogenase catalytic domain-containing protein [Cyclobacteriaceae bacterium]|nr:alcohol dehydrogenase catalytic domain-containing protein [Cyclobacteriaceae bacterium]